MLEVGKSKVSTIWAKFLVNFVSVDNKATTQLSKSVSDVGGSNFYQE